MENVSNKFTPKDLAQMLAINAETLRKYALSLESAGYIFTKTSGGHREYYEKDVMVFNQFKSLLTQSGMTLEMAAKIVAAKHSRPTETVTASPIPAQNNHVERIDERYQLLADKLALLATKEALDTVLAEVQQIKEHNEKLTTYIGNRLEERDRVLMETLKLMLEARKEVAAEKVGKKRWWKVWR